VIRPLNDCCAQGKKKEINVKGRFGNPKRPFAWSAAGSAAHKAFIAVLEISDNASRYGMPTPLLNHETSDHLLSRC
jgi:hypothetical protein